MKRTISHRPQHHKVTFGSQSYEVVLTFSQRETLKITVHPDQRVTVLAPLGKPVDEILQRIRRRSSWIVKQRDHFERYQPLPSERRYVTGESHWYLGRKYRLKVRAANEERVTLTRGILWTYVTNSENGSVKGLLDSWYRERLTMVFAGRLANARQLAKRAGLPEPRFVFRLMKRRWGSCAKSGRITLNTELIKASVNCIDYVIVHELCHLRHRDHGKEFYRLLGRLMPDWRERKARLERVQV